MRILLQTAVAVRFIGAGHADQKRANKKLLEEPVGKLYKKVKNGVYEPLPLREACNKIIHAQNIVLDSNKGIDPCTRFIKPAIFCYDDFHQKTGWKAEIDLLPFVEWCDALVVQF